MSAENIEQTNDVAAEAAEKTSSAHEFWQNLGIVSFVVFFAVVLAIGIYAKRRGYI